MNNLSIYSSYLEKHGLHPTLIPANPEPELSTIVIIPSHEEKDLIKTLQSLKDCEEPNTLTEVIVILNHSESAPNELILFHKLQYEQLQNWIKINSTRFVRFHCIEPLVFKNKIAGVGSARKAGMDEAINRFKTIANSNGIIVNLDADCIVESSYLKDIENYFSSPDRKSCLSINFSHRIDDEKNHKAILEYELHLRYYIASQKLINYPYAFQTLGSCFAVRALDYCRQGGMNQRKAGEDFYFLHKFSVNNQLDELDKVLVYPSSRISERVPFGTGRAIIKFEENKNQLTYSLEAILLFGKLISLIPGWYNNDSWKEDLISLHEDLFNYFIDEQLESEIKLCRNNCATIESFTKRLLKWFNPFRLMKYLHYMRDHQFPDQEVKLEAQKLLSILDEKNSDYKILYALLSKIKEV
ncbi:MAG: glycosyltransferase [Saprospiraceae bacterium]|nr:glycosyltransferase [Saprospiraceae bacterium]